jgi:hypothetical protein
VKESAHGVARCAKDAIEKYGEFADLAIAGAGLSERAGIVHEAGQTSLSAAEHLEKTSEVSELALQQVARASSDNARVADNVSLQGMRLIGDGLARGALAARCAADEAISTATKSLELSCSLVALDREWRREREQAQRQEDRDDSPRVAKDPRTEEDADQDAKDTDGRPKKTEDKKEKDKDSDNDSDSNDKSNTKKDRSLSSKEGGKRLSDIERIKRQHIHLRMKNLQCLGSLNEEVLQLQEQLRSLFKKGEGGMLPAISLSQKDGVFDLVKQLLNAAFQEAGKLAADASVPAKHVLDRAFAFALALEHTKEVALSSEVRTHVLKLAALVDLDLLCQIIDGPFRGRLLGLDKARRPSATAAASTFSSGFPGRGLPSSGNRQSARPGQRGSVRSSEDSRLGRTGEAFNSWAEVVDSFCSRLLQCLHAPLAGSDESGAEGKSVHP